MKPDSNPGGVLAGTLAVAATYFHFLLFAQFAFLALTQRAVRDPGILQSVLIAQGVSGIVGSVAAAVLFRPERTRALLVGGLLLCAATAGVAPQAATPLALGAVSALTGLALGLTTVSLASGLRAVVGPARLGLSAGLGTGVAYGLCNVPVIFNAAPAVQAVLAAGVSLAGALAAWGTFTVKPVEAPPAPDKLDRWIFMFLALVWLDSAGFYVIQHTPELKAVTWSGDTNLYIGAAIHLGVAVIAGWWLDRGSPKPIMGLAAVLLAFATLTITDRTNDLRPVGPAYAAGVSLYSTALVFYPAHLGRAWLTALVFAICGWVGSALGIGMAQDLHGIPPIFSAAAAGVVLANVLRSRPRNIDMLVLAALFLLPRTARAQDGLVAAGREVYIAEGRIHCHSQYVRPRTADVVRWGPVRPLAEVLAAWPPLLGNRRQGPDLQNVANRRGPEWNRLHLSAPREITPGSVMPSYAHLFAGDGARGAALLAYLQSLGADTIEARLAANAAWQPAADAPPLAGPAQEKLFRQLCAPCHGDDGRGGGPLAAKLAVRPRDLAREPWLYLGAPAGADAERMALARVIKFGLPGTAMAGREYLADSAVVSLAAYLQSLRGR